MEVTKVGIKFKHFPKEDYDGISIQKLHIKTKNERKKKKPKSLPKRNVDKIINIIKNLNSKEINKENNETKERNHTNESTGQSQNEEKEQNDTEESRTLFSSHSSTKLIKVEEIKDSSDDESKIKSDDECGTIDKKKTRKQKFEELKEKEEEEINKKDNINFNNNIKKIFNNIGNINIHKFEKDIDKGEDNKDNKNKEKDDLVLNIYKKEEKIRKLYYSQLLLKKVWKPLNDSKRHNSLIIFDWDDTLLPTSFLAPRGIFDDESELNEKDQAKINILEDSVQKLLTLAITKGDVYIITNAGDGWVDFSAKKYYPNILELLNKITVISAREVYEDKYPEDSKKWKIESFLNLKKKLNDSLITNIICLGDSIFEMEAGRILASKFIHAVIKTIKFREKPKPEELNKQLNLVLNQFNSIFNSSKNLTVRVEKKKKKNE